MYNMNGDDMIHIIGAGLAGSEAAYYLANQGIQVKLYEMRPIKMTPAHQTGHFAELVCSNSLRSNDPHNAVGMLKKEMMMLGSLIMEAALHSEVPAGSSLAVDRNLFSSYIESKIYNHPLIEVVIKEVEEINLEDLTIIAAGPLASDALAKDIQDKFHINHLHFFDAIAPIIEASSIDMNTCYLKSRYDKGEAAYINCPMDENQYNLFYDAITQAKRVEFKDYEMKVFEGCMPFEVMAERGKDTLLFGPMKPVGLEKDGKRYHAVVQLRQDDAAKTMYNIVGFQTHLTWDEQKKVIQLIPGLENAHILRYGVMHRNTYIESPKLINQSFQSIEYPNLYFAGQISGVEGYVESAASGLNVAIQITSLLKQNAYKPLPIETMIGAMARYVSTPNPSFVPMNANLGLLPPLEFKHRKKNRKQLYFERSIEALKQYLGED